MADGASAKAKFRLINLPAGDAELIDGFKFTPDLRAVNFAA